MDFCQKLLVVSMVFGCMVTSSWAQTPKEEYEAYKQKMRSEYSNYKNDKQKEYEAFRKKSNEEYAAFMRERWEQMPVKPAIPIPEKPKPPKPVVVPPDKIPVEPIVIPYEEITIPVEVNELPEIPLPTIEIPEAKPLAYLFFGTPCTVTWSDAMAYRIEKLDGNYLADLWTRLSEDDYVPMLNDVVQTANDLHLNDWGLVMLVREMSKALFGEENSEAVFLQAFVLAQLGAKYCMAHNGESIVLLMPLGVDVYNYPYFEIDGEKYFQIQKSVEGDHFEALTAAYPQSQELSLWMEEQPLLSVSKTKMRRFQSEQNPSLQVSVSVNKNLIDFYDNYPITAHWELYSAASLSKDVKEQLYPELQRRIKGKGQVEAANLLLNFVQTSFDYATDPEQFGAERPLFGDESFYYPYNDCEDRSILYSILVKDLLGLDVVLLEFPGHLATAVHFTKPVSGDYLDIDGDAYTVCDPTYIGAPVGLMMPECRTQELKVVLLK